MENDKTSKAVPTVLSPKTDNKEMTNHLDSDWQASTKSTRERNAVMLNNELIADVHFIVGSDSNQRRIPAHKYILVTGSSVFFAMFYGGLAEDTKEVSIPDVEPQAFLNLLKYLYCDEISLEADTVLPTLYAAKKYIMPHLTQACVDYLQTDLDASNACLLLSHSRLFDETELTQHCFDVIDSQTKEALQADSFTDIDYQTLELILRRDTLCVEETVVFAAARRWAEVECSRQGHPVTPEQCREVLGDALYLVRFPTMTPGEFADCAEQSDFLSKQEIVDIFFFFSAKNKPQLRFPTEPRKFQLRRFTPCTCSRFQATNSSGRFFLNGQRNCIRFSVDKAVFVSGFGLYGSCEVGVEYCIVIALEHDEVSLRRKRHKMTCDGSKKTIRVSFDAPFRIEANTYYTASLVVESAGRQPGQEHYGRSGVPHVKCENVIFTFKDSSVGENQSSVVQGQIPEILFHC